MLSHWNFLRYLLNFLPNNRLNFSAVSLYLSTHGQKTENATQFLCLAVAYYYRKHQIAASRKTDAIIFHYTLNHYLPLHVVGSPKSTTNSCLLCGFQPPFSERQSAWSKNNHREALWWLIIYHFFQRNCLDGRESTIPRLIGGRLSTTIMPLGGRI